MNAKIPKRASRRLDVRYDATLVTSDGDPVGVVIIDLSAHGFRIQVDEELRVGEQVILRTGRDGDVPARIVWALGSEAGGEFLAKSVVA